MYRLLVADDEIIERKVLLKTLQKNLEGQCEAFSGRKRQGKLWRYMKKKRSRSPYWILRCRALMEYRQQKRSEKKIKTAVLSFSQPMMNFLYAKKGYHSPCLGLYFKTMG